MAIYYYLRYKNTLTFTFAYLWSHAVQRANISYFACRLRVRGALHDSEELVPPPNELN